MPNDAIRERDFEISRNGSKENVTISRTYVKFVRIKKCRNFQKSNFSFDFSAYSYTLNEQMAQAGSTVYYSNNYYYYFNFCTNFREIFCYVF